jgi:hypothetical protein
MSDIDSLDIAKDRLDGAEAIAKFVGHDLFHTRYLIRQRLLPFGRMGNRIVASKRALREHYLATTAGTKPAA